MDQMPPTYSTPATGPPQASKIIPMLVGVLIGIAIGAGGYWVYLQTQPKTISTTTSTTTTTASTPATSTSENMITRTPSATNVYTNTKYHYAFTIPNDYVVLTTDACGNDATGACGTTALATATSKAAIVQPKSVKDCVGCAPSLTFRGLAQDEDEHNIEPYNYLSFITDPAKAVKITLAGHVAYEATADIGNATKIIAGEIIKGQNSVLIYQYGADPVLQNILDSFTVTQ